jgi:hypothetical protein
LSGRSRAALLIIGHGQRVERVYESLIRGRSEPIVIDLGWTFRAVVL